MKIIVYHGNDGCESGCCGHIIDMDGADEKFTLSHPSTKSDLSDTEREAVYRRFAEELVTKMFGEAHVKDLDWGRCVISED